MDGEKRGEGRRGGGENRREEGTTKGSLKKNRQGVAGCTKEKKNKERKGAVEGKSSALGGRGKEFFPRCDERRGVWLSGWGAV